MARLLRRLRDEEEGQDLVEYGLLVVFIAIAVVGAVEAFGGSVSGLYNRLAAGVTLILGG